MKLRVGLIGAGWYGKTDLLRLVEVAPVDVVALAEVDSLMAAKAADLIASRQLSKKKPLVFKDYRKMLAVEKFDVVIVGTPDHWHALPTIDAIKAGADVFVQKPTSVDVVESQAMLAAARKYGRVVQVGIQRRSTPHLMAAKQEVIEAGLLGEVAHVDMCCYYHVRNRSRPEQVLTEVPEHLDFDRWTGPAPLRPFNKVIHPKGWRSFMEYGNGILGDMGVHMLDTARWMLGLGWPRRISSQGGILVDKSSIANTSDTQTATFDFGKLQIVWQHRSWGQAPDPAWPWAVIFYGSKGTLKCNLERFEFIPRDKKAKGIKRQAFTELEKYPTDATDEGLGGHIGPAIRGHMRDFLTNIQSRGRPMADIEEGHISSVCCILGNHAMDLGRTLEWDTEKGEVKGDAEANALLARPYREGYEHPDPKKV